MRIGEQGDLKRLLRLSLLWLGEKVDVTAFIYKGTFALGGRDSRRINGKNYSYLVLVGRDFDRAN